MKRKGLGKGMGTGYKNLIGQDPKVHSDSSRGLKQTVPIPPLLPKIEMADDKEMVSRLNALVEDDLTLKDLMEAEKEIGYDIEDVEPYSINYLGERDGWYLLNGKWVIAPSEEEAEEVAEEMVKEEMEEDPELFDQDWLNNHVYVSDTDRRIIAGEESDRVVEDMEDEDIVDQAGNKSEYDDLDIAIGDIDGESGEDIAKIDDLEKQKEKLVEDSKETVREEVYDEWYEGLDNDPIGFLVDEQGMYSREDALKASFIQIDIDEASEDAVATDGWAHFLSSYDGNYTTLPSGKVMWRDS